jgi:hypothetical protein
MVAAMNQYAVQHNRAFVTELIFFEAQSGKSELDLHFSMLTFLYNLHLRKGNDVSTPDELYSAYTGSNMQATTVMLVDSHLSDVKRKQVAAAKIAHIKRVHSFVFRREEANVVHYEPQTDLHYIMHMEEQRSKHTFQEAELQSVKTILSAFEIIKQKRDPNIRMKTNRQEETDMEWVSLGKRKNVPPEKKREKREKRAKAEDCFTNVVNTAAMEVISTVKNSGELLRTICGAHKPDTGAEELGYHAFLAGAAYQRKRLGSKGGDGQQDPSGSVASSLQIVEAGCH